MDERIHTLPRAADVLLASLLAIASMPLIVAIGLAIALFDDRPILFRQTRLGRDLRPFTMHKFRTLAVGSHEEETIAPRGDTRVTRIGRWLRHSRLDELPQLFDVIRGRMALVGPRPETPANLAGVDPELLARWLAVRPGLTGATQLAFIAEDDVLAHEPDPTARYRKRLVPAKAAHGVAWSKTRTAAGDLALLLRTPFVLASPRARAHSLRTVAALLREPSD